METKINLFESIAGILMRLRLTLEENTGHPPAERYMRIAKANSLLEAGTLKSLTGTIAGVFTDSMAAMINLTLEAKNLLSQAEPFKHLTLVGIEMLDLIRGGALDQILSLFNENARTQQSGNINILKDALNHNFNNLVSYINLIPSPEDLNRIGYELFRLSCIVQTGDKIDLKKTGKVRILQWAFNNSWAVGNVSITDFGKKNDTADGLWKSLDPVKETEDLNNLFTSLHYPQKEDDAPAYNRIKCFQYLNGLLTTGMLDNDTVNQLMNLDYVNKNLKKAVPYSKVSIEDNQRGELNLINGNAEDYALEGIELEKKTASAYSYYVLGKSNTAPGWRAETGLSFVPGFVAIKSRKKNPDKVAFSKGILYEGGLFSEGEADETGSDFFFAARLTEPWNAGRSTPPIIGNTAFDIISPAELQGKCSRIYQDVNFIEKVNDIPEDHHLRIWIKARMRSLFNDKKTNGNCDQGRIGLQLVQIENNVGVVKWNDNNLKNSSGWYPQDEAKTLELLAKELHDQKNQWTTIESDALLIKKGDSAGFSPADGLPVTIPANFGSDLKVRVILEGRYSSGWDIDAYFDNIFVYWEYVAATQS